MKIILVTLFIGNLTATSYRSVPNQTDSSPFHTSTGQRVQTGGVAISQDILCGACRKLHKRCKHPEYTKKLHYGDTLYLKEIGFVIINDCMGKVRTYKIKTNSGTKKLFKKQLNSIDVWVPFEGDEKRFHKKYGINKHAVWLVKITEETK